MRVDAKNINEKTPYEELTEGLMMFQGGNSKLFKTGEWRTNTPVFEAEKCKQCLLPRRAARLRLWSRVWVVIRL